MKQIREWRMRRKRKDPLNTHTVHKKAAVSVVICYHDKINRYRQRKKGKVYLGSRLQEFQSCHCGSICFGVYSDGEDSRELMGELTSCLVGRGGGKKEAKTQG